MASCYIPKEHLTCLIACDEVLSVGCKRGCFEALLSGEGACIEGFGEGEWALAAVVEGGEFGECGLVWGGAEVGEVAVGSEGVEGGFDEGEGDVHAGL